MPQPLRVLFTQDNPDDAGLLLHALRCGGFEPEWKRVATEAEYLDALHAGLDLVLADFQMTQFTGLRALELLKQRGLDVPFILISGAIGEDKAVLAMKSGASDFLLKDRLGRLAQAVSDALEQRRTQRESKRVENDRRESHESYRMIAKNYPNGGGVLFDLDLRLIVVDGAGLTEAGLATGHLQGKILSEAFSPEICAILEPHYRAALAGEVRTFELSFAGFRFESHALPLRDQQDRVVGGIAMMQNITARKRAEEALRASEVNQRQLAERLVTAQEVGNVGSWETDLSTMQVSWSVQTHRIFETDQATFTPTHALFLAMVHPADRAAVSEAFVRSAQREVLCSIEHRILLPNGKIKFVDERWRVFPDGPNGSSRAVGTCHDITERKQAEEALRESEQFVRAALDGLCAHIAILDEHGIILAVNEAWRTFAANDGLQWERGGVGACYLDACDGLRGSDAEDPGTLAQAIRDILQGRRTSYSAEYACHAPTERRWFNVRITPFPGDGPRRVVVAHENITQRRLQQDELRRSEERFRQVVESIHEVFWIVDLAENRVIYVSLNYEEIWGQAPDKLYAKGDHFVENICPEDRERYQRAVQATPTGGKLDETFRIVRPDGTLRWIHCKVSPVLNEWGAVYRLIGVAEDVTERKKLEEQFLRAQRLESVGMLAAGIAHDLNNVLAPVGMASTLLRKNTTEIRDLRLLDTLEKCADRGAGLVRQILGFAQGVSGEMREVQVKHLLRDIIDMVTQTFPKSIILEDNVPNDLWPIKAIPTQIHQVLLNLCVNARDAMPRGGTLRLHAENCVLDAASAASIIGARLGTWMKLEVQDSGSGIPPEVLARIWEPFFTTKTADKGTGLGLSTVRGIVETHRGFITLETKIGEGTAFRIYFPALHSAGPQGHENPKPPAGRGRGELILVVDDEKPIREIASAILTRYGYRVLTASDGVEAIASFVPHASEIALIITDLDMPSLDGAALGRAIRRLDPTKKILAMSGLPGGSHRHSGTGRPDEFSSAFIAKPFAAEALLAVVEQLLRGNSPP